jgi:hypothetical protein
LKVRVGFFHRYIGEWGGADKSLVQ